jgi:peptidoglycan/LPS O-acetylase OafA/YrhL
MSTVTERKHIVGLDLIRFASAAMVMFYHLAFWSWAPPANISTIRHLMPGLPRFPELTSILSEGWVGVEIFFVLSGFVIAYSAEGSGVFMFFRSRFLRLMPTVWICATLVFLAFAAGGTITFKDLSLLYIKSLVLFPKAPWIDPVYWSLCVEVIFYGLILCLLLANRFCQVEMFMGAIGIGSAMIWIVFGVFSAMPTLFGSPLVILELIYSWEAQPLLVHYGCFFAFGVYLWLLMFKGVTLRRGSIACVCFVGGIIEIMHTAQEQINQVGLNLPRLMPAAIWVIFTILIIASIAMNGRVQTRLGRFVPAFRMLGLMTYPLYLFHQTIGNALIGTMHHFGMPRFFALFLSATTCVFISWIIAAVIEPLFRQNLQNTIARIGSWLGRQERTAFLFRVTSPVIQSAH